MSSMICNTVDEAREYRRYLKRVHGSNSVVFYPSIDTEVVYYVPFTKNPL